MFTLPVWEIARGWLLTVVLAPLVAVALTAGVGWRGWEVRTRVLVHLAVLGALVLPLVAWQYRLDAFDLVYSQRGVVFGAGYTDVHAQLPAYNLLAIVTLVAAVLLIVTAVLRRGLACDCRGAGRLGGHRRGGRLNLPGLCAAFPGGAQ